MPEGIEVEVKDGFAHVQFLDPALKGPALTRVLDITGPGVIDVDTRTGARKIYIIPEGTALAAGLLDGDVPADPEPVTLPDGTPDDTWTIAQMQKFAADQEISLTGATKKADILATITAALTVPPPSE